MDDKFEMVALAICWAEFSHPDPAVQGTTPEAYWEKCSDQTKRHFRKLALAAVLELRGPHDLMDQAAAEIIGAKVGTFAGLCTPKGIAFAARQASMDSILNASGFVRIPWPPDNKPFRWPDPDNPPKWETNS